MPRVLYFITEDWFFVSHFRPMARAARDAGLDVTVATRVRDQGSRIISEGYRLIPLEIDRSGNAVVAPLRSVVQAYRIVRQERPDVVHCIALPAAVLGGLAARLAGAKSIILAPTGLGYAWSVDSFGARCVRGVARLVLGNWLRSPRTQYLFENSEDPGEFGLQVADPTVTIVHGAGVDPTDFPLTPEPPSPPVKVAVVSRMLRSKGIAEAVAAIALARERGAAVELDIFGAPDPSNPLSIPVAELERWGSKPGISWRGPTTQVAEVWREHHVALFLTSYREGIPRTLIEAAASGRPIITSDAVGCREVVRDGQEGLLVPVGDVAAAAQAIVTLAHDPDLRRRLGEGANRRFHERFTECGVRQTMTNLYAKLTAEADDGGTTG